MKADLSATSFKNNAVVAGATACSAEPTMSLTQFNAVTSTQISTTFLGCKMGFNPSTYIGLVILDIEEPIPPQQWYLQDHVFFTSLKLRIDTIRGLLPKAKLGIYGVCYAPYLGLVSGSGYAGGKTWESGPLVGYKMAATAHAFDSLDYLCPVCPVLWGPGDTTVQQACVLPCVTIAINQTQALGTGKKLAPIIRWKIYNTASKVDRQHVSAQTLIDQIYTATNTRQIDSIIIWAGVESDIDQTVFSSVSISSVLGKP